MAKLAYAPDLGSGGAIRAGSTPVTRTKETPEAFREFLFVYTNNQAHSFRFPVSCAPFFSLKPQILLQNRFY